MHLEGLRNMLSDPILHYFYFYIGCVYDSALGIGMACRIEMFEISFIDIFSRRLNKHQSNGHTIQKHSIISPLFGILQGTAITRAFKRIAVK